MGGNLTLAVDIGYTYISAAWINTVDTRIEFDTFRHKNVARHATRHMAIKEWGDTIREVMTQIPYYPVHVGIAVPDRYEYALGISSTTRIGKEEPMFSANMKSLLAAELGIDPDCIRVCDYATSFLFAECRYGAGRGFDHVIGLVLDGGLGGALYRNRVTVSVDLWDLPFKDGVAGNYFALPWILNRYSQLSGDSVDSIAELLSHDVYDERVRKVFDEYTGNLAEFLRTIITVTDPNAVLIGGSIVQCADYFVPMMKSSLLNCGIEIPVHVATLGQGGMLIGAAHAWKAENHYHSNFSIL